MKRLFYLSSVLLLSISMLMSCDKPGKEGESYGPLPAPELNVTSVTSESFTISWDIVDNALYYVYRVNGGEEKATSQMSLKLSDLEIGSYVVDVKAKPVPGTQWTDSEWSSVTVDLELEDDWFLLDDVYLKDDDLYGNFKYNSVYFLLTGYDVQQVKADIFESSTIEGLGDDEISAKLTMNMTEDGLTLLNSSGRLEGVFAGLEPETEYVVVAKATHVDGQEKLVVSEPISTEPVPDMPEGLADWIGSYKVRSASSLEIYAREDGTAGYNIHDTPIEFGIDIEPSPNDVKTLYMYGWSILEEQLGTRLPARAQLSDDGGLSMKQGYVNHDSYSLTWMPICLRSDDSINILTMCDVIFTMYDNDGIITLAPYSGNSAGYDFTVIAADLFIMGQSVQIPHDIPAYLPAGEFTVERIESGQAPRLVFPSTEPSTKIICL